MRFKVVSKPLSSSDRLRKSEQFCLHDNFFFKNYLAHNSRIGTCAWSIASKMLLELKKKESEGKQHKTKFKHTSVERLSNTALSNRKGPSIKPFRHTSAMHKLKTHHTLTFLYTYTYTIQHHSYLHNSQRWLSLTDLWVRGPTTWIKIRPANTQHMHECGHAKNIEITHIYRNMYLNRCIYIHLFIKKKKISTVEIRHHKVTKAT